MKTLSQSQKLRIFYLLGKSSTRRFFRWDILGASAKLISRLSVGYRIDTQDLYVSGTLNIPTGASSGKVLTSDANGKASWQSSMLQIWDSTSGQPLPPIDSVIMCHVSNYSPQPNAWFAANGWGILINHNTTSNRYYMSGLAATNTTCDKLLYIPLPNIAPTRVNITGGHGTCYMDIDLNNYPGQSFTIACRWHVWDNRDHSATISINADGTNYSLSNIRTWGYYEDPYADCNRKFLFDDSTSFGWGCN